MLFSHPGKLDGISPYSILKIPLNTRFKPKQYKDLTPNTSIYGGEEKTTTKRHAMTSEEAARTLNLEHDLYLALITEETRKNYEAAGLYDDFLMD